MRCLLPMSLGDRRTRLSRRQSRRGGARAAGGPQRRQRPPRGAREAAGGRPEAPQGAPRGTRAGGVSRSIEPSEPRSRLRTRQAGKAGGSARGGASGSGHGRGDSGAFAQCPSVARQATVCVKSNGAPLRKPRAESFPRLQPRPFRTSGAPPREELRDECASDLERLDNSAAAGPVNADDFFKPVKLALEGGGSPKARLYASVCIYMLCCMCHACTADASI